MKCFRPSTKGIRQVKEKVGTGLGSIHSSTTQSIMKTFCYSSPHVLGENGICFIGSGITQYILGGFNSYL